MRIEEEGESRGKGVNRKPTFNGGMDILHAIAKREGQFLGCGRARLPDVIPTDRHAVPSREMVHGMLDGVHHQFDRGFRWIDEFVLGMEFLEDVVL